MQWKSGWRDVALVATPLNSSLDCVNSFGVELPFAVRCACSTGFSATLQRALDSCVWCSLKLRGFPRWASTHCSHHDSRQYPAGWVSHPATCCFPNIFLLPQTHFLHLQNLYKKNNNNNNTGWFYTISETHFWAGALTYKIRFMNHLCNFSDAV